MGSASAKALKEALLAEGIKTFRKMPQHLPPKNKTLTIYYGGTDVFPEGGIQLNRNRAYAQNKLSAFQKFAEHNISCVPWTVDPVVAADWDTTVAVS